MLYCGLPNDVSMLASRDVKVYSTSLLLPSSNLKNL